MQQTDVKPKKIVIVEMYFWADEDVNAHDLMYDVSNKYDLLGQGGHALADELAAKYGKVVKFTTVSYEQKDVASAVRSAKAEDL